jgi:hypothetical protein
MDDYVPKPFTNDQMRSPLVTWLGPATRSAANRGHLTLVVLARAPTPAPEPLPLPTETDRWGRAARALRSHCFAADRSGRTVRQQVYTADLP